MSQDKIYLKFDSLVKHSPYLDWCFNILNKLGWYDFLKSIYYLIFKKEQIIKKYKEYVPYFTYNHQIISFLLSNQEKKVYLI